jgi:hypothetical protein
METITTPVTEAPPAPTASRWEDFLDILYAPAEVFRRRPDGRFGLVLLIVAVLMALLFWAGQSALAPAYDAEFARAMEGQDIPADQLAASQGMMQTFGMISFIIGFPIGVMVVGLVLWLVGKAMGSVATASMAIMIAAYAQVPRLIQQVLATVQGMLMDVTSLYHVSFSPARFMDPDETGAVAMAIASRMDLFVLWSTFILAVGLVVLGGLPRNRAYIAAGLVWVIGTAPLLIGAMF